MKPCSKCGVTKPTNEYGRDAQKRDGLRPYCKACDNAASAKYRSANKDKVRSVITAWKAANVERVKETNAAWSAANYEKRKAQNAIWRAANPKRLRGYEAKHYAANPEAKRIKDHNRRARQREAGGRLSKGLADRLFKLQRGKCACCGEPLGDNYQLDHIMPIALGGENTDDNIQLLRAKCNRQKCATHPAEFMRQRGFLL